MRHFENWLKAYVEFTSASESPTSFHFWTGIATIAGALQRKVWRDERIFQWTPNFYIVLVGPPGIAAKSTSIRIGLSMLEEIEGIHFGPQSMTWQALTKSLEEAQCVADIPGQIEGEIMSCVTCGVSELGTFLRTEDDELISTLIAMWDGQKETWRRKTVTQGDTVIRNPWLNVIGCTTPAWLKASFPELMIGGGLTSRIIFVYGDQKRQLVAYPSDVIENADHKKFREKLVDDLKEIASLAGEFDITDEGKAWGRGWYKRLYEERPAHMASERFDGYRARKQVHLHKVAMVLACAKRSDLVLTKDDLEEADIILTDIEHSMLNVFTAIGHSPAAKVSGQVLSLIANHKSIDYQLLWRECFNMMGVKDFQDAIKSALEAKYIRIDKRGSQTFVTYIGPTSQSADQSPD